MNLSDEIREKAVILETDTQEVILVEDIQKAVRELKSAITDHGVNSGIIVKDDAIQIIDDIFGERLL